MRVPMRPESQVTFDDEIVTKAYLENADIEFEKSLRIWEISNRNEFDFPKPLSLDRDGNKIEFARIRDTYSIRNDYLCFMKQKAPDTSLLSVFARSGEVLGILHRDLVLPDTVAWRPPTDRV